MKKIITLLVFCFAGGMVMAQTPALKVDQSGNVGVNIATPESKLHVRGGDVLLDGSLVTSKRVDDGSLQQVFGMDANDDMTINRGSILSGQNSAMLFGVGANKSMFVFGPGIQPLVTVQQATGNMGIGTTTPGFTLEVAGTAAKDGGGVWAATSDKRAKKNIQSYKDGLDIIMQMNPVSFSYNGKFGTKNNDNKYIGVIAQEMKKLAPYMVNDALHVSRDISYTESGLKNNVIGQEEYLTYDGTALPYILVNAVQEQQSIIEELKKENDDLRSLIASIAERLDNTDQSSTTTTISGNEKVASLEQNNPNPFTDQTSISYFVPSNAQSASIAITSATGQILKTVNISNKGQGVLDLKAENLPRGTYQYTLVVDGKSVKTNKMILAQ